MVPTEPGFYWARLDRPGTENAPPLVVEVYRTFGDRPLCVVGGGCVGRLDSFVFLSGPLVPPSERTELEHLRSILDKLEAKAS